MLTKEEFCKCINNIDEYLQWEDKVDDVLGVVIEVPDLVSPVISLLDKEMGVEEDEYTGGDINYFIFDMNFGRNYEPGMVTDENGNDIDYSTPEKLYDYLVSCHEEK